MNATTTTQDVGKNIVVTGKDFITEIRIDRLEVIRQDINGIRISQINEDGISGYARSMMRNTFHDNELGDEVYYAAFGNVQYETSHNGITIQTNVRSPFIGDIR